MIVFVSAQNFLFLLALIPIILLCLRGFTRKRKALRAFHQQDSGLFENELMKVCLLTFALGFLATVLAHPVLMKATTLQGVQGNYLFLVDTSTSMAARKNPASRSSLEDAKKIIGDTIDVFPESCTAIFIFSKLVFPVSSLTCDREILRGVLDKEIAIDRIPYKGTRIGNALLAISDKIKDPIGIYHDIQHIVVLTDGGDALLTAEEARKINESLSSLVDVSFVGVGDALGNPIPVFDKDGIFSGQYMQSNGSTYYARLDEAILKNIAAQLHGRYFSSEQEDALLESLRNGSSLHKTTTLDSVDLRMIFLALCTISLFVLLKRRDL